MYHTHLFNPKSDSMGKLVLKGKHQKAFEKVKKSEKKKATTVPEVSTDDAARLRALPKKGETMEGTGRIVSAEETVHGFETCFMEELEPGDIIIVLIASSAVKEERVVFGVLSCVSNS